MVFPPRGSVIKQPFVQHVTPAFIPRAAGTSSSATLSAGEAVIPVIAELTSVNRFWPSCDSSLAAGCVYC